MSIHRPGSGRPPRTEKRTRKIPCDYPDRVSHAGKEGNYYWCWHCGFPCNTDRDELGPGDGVEPVAYTSSSDGETKYEPVVSSGCPFCGCKNYK